ncbi:hypothetical protein C8A05DRAFT_15673 [Staphylotrichum tortipilum]|uniref:Uncharacterized protein n=1 Tax=Staphylotrichum tortipilum TaxID=2831512 RepID=A0AAN6ML68_9PEZI|nr:hypothetical protein C8A05DRAFT_15673 [Staphylotrichum longicolle]
MDVDEIERSSTGGELARVVNYEVQRSFVWEGVEGGGVDILGLSALELEGQLGMVKARGGRDWVRVVMAVEVE